jgi:hypothetical protein
MILNIGETTIDITVDDSSFRERGIGRKNELTLNFSLDHHIEVPVGAWCEFQGQRYELYSPDNFTEKGYREFDYTLILNGDEAKLKKYKCRNTVDRRLKFDMTAKPSEFAKLMVDNLNQRDSGWTVGTCTDAVAKCLNLNHNYIEDVAGMVEQAFEMEVYLVGKSICIGKQEVNKDEPLALSVGAGLKEGVKRENATETNNVEILYVQGGDRNIDFSKYGSKELLLPKSQSITYNGRTYVTDADGYSVKRSDVPQKSFVEDSLDLSNIYPMREGTVSEVVVVNAEKNFYDFKDSSIPEALDFSTCRIAGERATVMFLTGMLAQRTFDIEQTETALTGYVHAERRFKLVPAELDGVTMPNGTFKPAVGDKYAVFGISMPDAYVCDSVSQTGASWDMLKEAVKYLYENESSKFNITAELDGIWAKKDWANRGGKIVVGGYVQIGDSKFNPNGDVTRIVTIKDFVNNPHSPTIEITNSAKGGSFVSSIKKLQGQEVAIEASKKELVQYTKRRFRDTQETAKMLEQSMLNFSGSINPISVNAMQLLVGDQSLQFRYVSSKTSPATVTPSIYYTAATKIFHADRGVVQHMTLGITSVKPSRPASEYRYWDVTAFNSPAIDDATKSYYVYLKCSKSNQAAAYYLSESPIGIEQVDGYYHLWVGILNSEFDGDRSFVKLFGFTEILPGRVTAEMFSSPDGNTFIDLVNGIMQGKFTFKAGSKGLEQLDEWANKQSQIDTAASNAAAASATAAAAATAANTAKADAEAANQAIADMVSDGKLSPVEKQSYKVIFDGYTSEKVKYDAQADQFAVSRTAYDAAYDALNAYLTPLLADLTTTSDIVSATFTSTLKSYTDARTDLTNAIAAKAKTAADNAQAKVDNMQIGGVNLIQSEGLTSYVPNNSTPIWDGATRSIRTTINALDSLSLASSKINMIPAGVYTASGYLKRNGTIVTSSIWKDVRFNKYFSAIRSKIDDTTGYFEITQEIDSRLFFIDMPLPNGTQVGDVFEWVKLKFEKGNKATYYTLSPEDITADAQAKADAAKEAAIAAAAADATTKVDNMQIGGVNLIQSEGLTSYVPNNSTPIWDGATRSIRTTINALDSLSLASSKINMIPAGVYTASGYLKRNGTIVTSSIWKDVRFLKIFPAIRSRINDTTGYFEITQEIDSRLFFIDMPLPNGTQVGDVFEWVKLKFEKGNKATDYDESPEDRKAQINALTYLKTALAQQTTTEGGLLLTSLIQLGEWLNGVFTAKAGVNGVGSNPLSPTFWGGGTLEDAIRTVNELINGTKSGNPRAPFVVSRDGKIFGFEGYIAGFRMIEKLLNMDTLDIGEVNGLPMIRVRDKSNNNRDAVIIADMPLSDPASLAGGGAIDVTPSYVIQETSAEEYSFWLTQSGISTTKSALSTGVSANTAYSLIFNLNASNSVLDSYLDSRIENMTGSSLWATFTIKAYDANNTLLSSFVVPFNGSSDEYGYTYILDRVVAMGINTLISGNLYVEVKMESNSSRYLYEQDLKRGYRYTSNMVVAVKSNTKVQLISGKGLIEIGRGLGALYGINKFFQIQDKPGVPLVRAEGEFEFNKCMMQDILLQFWATGTKGFNLSINRWQGHSAFTSKDNIGIARTGTGTYTITHNLKTRGIINNSGDYQVTGHGSEYYITVTMQAEDSVKITTNDDASPNDTANLFLQFWSTKNWKTT